MDSHDDDARPKDTEETRHEQIARLNDQMRKQRKGGYWCITDGVVALGHPTFLEISKAIAEHDTFDPGNDPYGERDFGEVRVGPHRIFWKIDYYDLSQTAASPDPADPSVTSRLLTVMLASEY